MSFLDKNSNNVDVKNLSKIDPFIKWLLPLYCILVAGLQFQATPVIKTIPLRFSIADVILGILPFFCLAYLVIKRKKFWSEFLVTPWILIWCVAASIWFTFSLWWGYHQYDSLQSWALINKYVGWFMLLAYLFVGGFFGSYLTRYSHLIIKILLATSWAVAFYCILGTFLINQFHIVLPRVEFYRYVGFFENPTAYGLFSVFAILLQFPFLQKNSLFSRRWHDIGLGLNLTVLIYSGSRTAIVALLVGFVVLACKTKFKRQDFKGFLIAAGILLFFSFNNYILPKLFPNLIPKMSTAQVNHGYLFQEELWNGKDAGGKQRLETSMDALNVWLKNPLLGCGLGGFLKEQNNSFDNYELYLSTLDHMKIVKTKPNLDKAVVLDRYNTSCCVFFIKNGEWVKYPSGQLLRTQVWTAEIPELKKIKTTISSKNAKDDLILLKMDNFKHTNKIVLEATANAGLAPVMIHTTSLWLLTETGLIGLILFVFFGVRVLQLVNKASTSLNDTNANPLILGGLSVLIAFAAASITTEIMYQRHIWFLIGLLLGVIKSQHLLMNQTIRKE